MGFAERLRTSLESRWPDLPGRVGFAAWDLTEGEPVTFGGDVVFRAASTMKVLVMIAALREVQRGQYTMDTEFALESPRTTGTGVLHELRSVHRLSLEDLITLMIVISDNAATNTVLDLVGFDRVNACARDLGCTATRVERHLMDIEATGQNVTSARDQARILDQLARERALPAELTAHALDVLSRQQVRDRLPAHLPVSVDCWNKTGEILGLRHDVGLLGRTRPRAVVAVLVDQLTDPLSSTRYTGGPACPAIAELGLAVHQSLD